MFSFLRLLPSPVLSAFGLGSLFLAILLTAWLNVALFLNNPSGRELAALMDRPREGVELCGVIADDPVWRAVQDGSRGTWSFPLRVDMIRRLPSWQTARGMVQIRLRDTQRNFVPRYGERWRLAGVLIDSVHLPSARPVKQLAASRYFYAADPSASVCLAGKQGSRLMAWCFRMRHQAARHLARGIDHRPDVVGLLRALLLGYRQDLPDKIRRDFQAVGTYHIFAISGQHIAILAMFVIVALQAQRVCRVRWFLYVAPLLIFFTVSTGLSSSAVRGCLMALLVLLGPLVNRKPDLPSALALAAILILAVNPLQLFNYGFLLSFAVVAGLIIFCPPALKAIQARFKPDPWRLEPERMSVRFWRTIAGSTALLMVATLVAWLVSTPFIARWFNLFSPVALLANLVVIPVSALVLLAACLSVLCGFILPWLGEVFNYANVALVSFLIDAAGCAAKITCGHCFVPAPPVWIIVLWFGTLLAWLPGRATPKIRIAGTALLAVALLSGFILEWRRASVHITNSGQVPVCLLKLPGAARVLVNAGSQFNARLVTQELQKQGVNRLAALVLPEASASHVGGALEILPVFRVHEIWCATTNARSPVFGRVLALARAQQIPIRTFAANEWMPWRNEMEWKYNDGSHQFCARRGATVLTIGRGAAISGRNTPATVTIQCPGRHGLIDSLRIECLDLPAAQPGSTVTNGTALVPLAQRQSLRVDLGQAGCIVGQPGNR